MNATVKMMLSAVRRLFGDEGRGYQPRYSSAQVLAVLRGEVVDGAAEIERQISALPILLGDEAVQRQYRHFPRYLDVLPRILLQYRRGIPPADLLEELDFLATEYGIQSVVEITAQVIAERLNQLPPDGGLPRLATRP